MNYYKKIITLALADFERTHPSRALKSTARLASIRAHLKRDVTSCVEYLETVKEDMSTDKYLSGYLQNAIDTIAWTQAYYKSIEDRMALTAVPTSKIPLLKLEDISFSNIHRKIPFFPEKIALHNFPYYAAFLIGLYGATTNWSYGLVFDLVINAGATAFTWTKMINGDKYKQIVFNAISKYERSSKIKGMLPFGSKSDARDLTIENLRVRENIPPKEFLDYAYVEASRIKGNGSQLKPILFESVTEARLLLDRDMNIQRQDPSFKHHIKMLYGLGAGLLLYGWWSGYDAFPGVQIYLIHRLIKDLLEPLYDFILDQQDRGVQRVEVLEDDDEQAALIQELTSAKAIGPAHSQVAVDDQQSSKQEIEAPVVKPKMQLIHRKNSVRTYYSKPSKDELRQFNAVIENFYKSILHVAAGDSGKRTIQAHLPKVISAAKYNLCLLNYFIDRILGEDSSTYFLKKNPASDKLLGKKLTEKQRVIVAEARKTGKAWIELVYNNNSMKESERLDILKSCLKMRLFNVPTSDYMSDPRSFFQSSKGSTDTIANIKARIKKLEKVIRQEQTENEQESAFEFNPLKF